MRINMFCVLCSDNMAHCFFIVLDKTLSSPQKYQHFPYFSVKQYLRLFISYTYYVFMFFNLRGGGHIVFSADHVGVDVCMRLCHTSCLHNIL